MLLRRYAGEQKTGEGTRLSFAAAKAADEAAGNADQITESFVRQPKRLLKLPNDVSKFHGVRLFLRRFVLTEARYLGHNHVDDVSKDTTT